MYTAIHNSQNFYEVECIIYQLAMFSISGEIC